MFYGCQALASIDLSKARNIKAQYYYSMFYGCNKLKSINLGGFNTAYYGYQRDNMFFKVPKSDQIVIHNKFYGSIYQELRGYNKITLKY